MTNSSVLDNYKDLMCDIAVNDPHVLLCSRTTSTDLTLGATLSQRVTYAVHSPATAAHQVHYASDENRTVSGVEADDESKYINWAYFAQEALDKYIFDTYGNFEDGVNRTAALSGDNTNRAERPHSGGEGVLHARMRVRQRR